MNTGAKGAPEKKKLVHQGSVLKRSVEDLNQYYTLGAELGRGQFGITYLATHKETKERFACKCISKRKLVTKEDAEDVEREVAIMYHLQGHPNIVSLKGCYEDKHTVQLVMELAEGGELFDRIVAKGHYTEKQAAASFRTIMQVVAQCHALGVMHRDLKPENFLLSSKADDAQLKATDFGLSMFFTPGQKFKYVVGSAYYVAPEVLKRSYSQEADVWSAGVVLYILLSGSPPFWAESEQAIFRAILHGHYDMKAEPWPRISQGAHDLVTRLLKHDPKERMTAAEALNHPWLREDGTAPDNVIDDGVMQRLKKFSQVNRFKKMALQVIAKNLSDAEIQGLRELFKSFDKDNSGTITTTELTEGLKQLQKEKGFGDAEVSKLMKSCDVDGNGTLSYEEFIAATIHQNKLESQEHLFMAFSHFDADNSGYITQDELLTSLKDHGLPTDNVEELISNADKNGDGKIDYEEFVDMMRSQEGSVLGAMKSRNHQLDIRST